MSGSRVDRWSVEQKQAIMARGHNVLVAAGAGSGKTSVLVERVVSLIFGEPAMDVDQLLVVTFTEAAAAEMRERVRNRLHELLEETKAAGDYPRMTRIIRQFSLLDQAQISTLHSFCFDIVKRNFLSLQFDPDFGILEGKETAKLREQIAYDMIDEYLRNEDQSSRDRFLHMLAAFDAKDPLKLIPLVLRIDTFSDSQPTPVSWLRKVAAAFPKNANGTIGDLAYGPSFYAWIERLADDSLYGLMNGLDLAAGVEGMEAYRENMDAMVVLLQTARNALRDSRDLSMVHSYLQAIINLKSPRAKSDVLNKEEISNARKQAIDIIKLLDEVIGRGDGSLIEDLVVQSESIEMLCGFVILFKSRVMEAKRAINKLYFSDLEHLALAALSMDQTGERERLKARYGAILVDEYQDTSPIQDAIIRQIIRMEGNLFTVGDVKQSIYRFRMAEPKLFMNQYESLGTNEPGEVIDLAANYRSRQEIVQCVNFVFTQLFTVWSSGFAYDERAQMRPQAVYPATADGNPLSNPIEIHLIERNPGHMDDMPIPAPVDEDDSNDGENMGEDDLSAIEKEALVIGQRILELTGQIEGFKNQWIYDTSLRHNRPVTFRDIVILLRSVEGRSRVIVDVLRTMSIPAIGSRSTGFYDSLEVKWLIAALTAVDNPRRELALVTLLRSPLIGFTNESLAKIRTAGKGNFYDALLRVIHGKIPSRISEDGHEISDYWQGESLIREVQEFWKLFDNWRKLARKASAGTVLNKVISDTGLLYYVSGMKGGLARKKNIETLLDEARSFDQTSTDGVFGFIAQIESLSQEPTAGSGVLGGVERDDAVRIMTIHGSKGLEFPVVFVADLGKQFNTGKSESSFGLHRDLGLGPVFYDDATNRKWRTIASIAISEREQSENAAEEARVLYVAMTRARERLIFVGSARNLQRLLHRNVRIALYDGNSMSKSSFLFAKTYLDWLIPAFLHHQACRKKWLPLLEREIGFLPGIPDWLDTNFAVQVMIWNHPLGRSLPFERLSTGKTEFLNKSDVTNVTKLIEQLYSYVGAGNQRVPIEVVEQSVESSAIPSKVSATELRRLWVATQEPKGKNEKKFVTSAAKLLADPEWITAETDSPIRAGSAFHKLLQCMDLGLEPSGVKIEQAIKELCLAGNLTIEDAQHIAIDDVLHWLQSPLFARIRNASLVYREQPFFHRIVLPSSRYVIVQGVIDCLAKESRGWLIVDYKTDHIDEDAVNEKVKEYEAQVGTYLAAVRSIVKDERIHAYLYFVKPRVAVRVKPIDVACVFHPGQ